MYWKVSDSSADVNTRPIHGGDGAIVTRDFFDGISRLPVKFQKWELGPGVSEGDHTHGGNNALEEIYYFLEGQGTMWVDGQDIPVKAGDAILVPPSVSHGFRNTADDPVKLIIVWGRPLEQE